MGRKLMVLAVALVALLFGLVALGLPSTTRAEAAGGGPAVGRARHQGAVAASGRGVAPTVVGTRQEPFCRTPSTLPVTRDE